MLLFLAVTTMLMASPEQLEQQTQQWHDKRLTRLSAEDGWLTLVGLAWLEEGASLAGSDPTAAVPLPAKFPARLGRFVREGKKVSFFPEAGLALLRNKQPFSGGPVQTDEDKAQDVLESGSLQLLLIVRGGKVGVRVRDSQAPARKDFAGIPRFKVSAAWQKQARFEKAPEGRTLPVPNVLGQVVDTPLAGTAVFEHEGKQWRLLATQDAESLFFVFGDLTNRDSTYGAGRFLVTGLPADGQVLLDFNRAYNPPCAFSPFATCPLPVKDNKLPIRIEAGERRYVER